MRTHVVHARADIVATKLGIILSFFLSSFLPRTFLPEGVYLRFLIFALLSIWGDLPSPPKFQLPGSSGSALKVRGRKERKKERKKEEE